MVLPFLVGHLELVVKYFRVVHSEPPFLSPQPGHLINHIEPLFWHLWLGILLDYYLAFVPKPILRLRHLILGLLVEEVVNLFLSLHGSVVVFIDYTKRSLLLH